MQEDTELTSSGLVKHEPRLVVDTAPKGKAKIVELKKVYNPLDDFNETNK